MLHLPIHRRAYCPACYRRRCLPTASMSRGHPHARAGRPEVGQICPTCIRSPPRARGATRGAVCAQMRTFVDPTRARGYADSQRNDGQICPSSISLEDAAKMLGVSRRSAATARQISPGSTIGTGLMPRCHRTDARAWRRLRGPPLQPAQQPAPRAPAWVSSGACYGALRSRSASASSTAARSVTRRSRST